ncbi:hypothetical protein CKAN_02002300 [Cinnamomum micranthum f. kanehirae]|uniref:Uncharacterized protein n=1 Tax=Cinnamomum micranthum f. kanehirae TaxID=337451 RepID=A0A3S3QWP4_9MAGN|nr:hypothetical protein CKAN_02002300 [Cinnamomum micranthum f. kanehirae]
MRSNPLKNQEKKKSIGDAFDRLLAQIFINRLRHNNNGSNINLLTTILTPSLPLISSSPNTRDESGLGYVAKEEVKIEGEIICIILSSDTDSLRPKSGQPILIYDHNVCIRFHNERGSEHLVWECHGHPVMIGGHNRCYNERGADHQVWEWHGHVMTYDEENGYSL